MARGAVGRRKAMGLLAITLIVGGPATEAGPALGGPGAGRLTITPVSNPHPEFVSGGDVLLRIDVPDGFDAADVRVELAHRDVTDRFVAQPDGTLLGLVDGLDVGGNRIRARVGDEKARVRVVNHDITGPVFSGPQQLPFFCETEAFGLEPAEQPDCAAPTVVSYVYRRTTGGFAPLTDPTTPPDDAATVTVDGQVLPFIVRLERGTINRAVYELAALYDGQDPSPQRAESGWNSRLVYSFGGGCNVGYHQGTVTGGVLNELFLARGYAVASASLNVLDNNCNHVISAETAMMVKEHAIETYGPVAHTIGWGGSGGAIQQHLIAQGYPGILDGIIPSASYPEAAGLVTVADCRLVARYFANTELAYTEEQRQLVSGYGDYGSCVAWDRSFANRYDADEGCPAAIPVDQRWSPTNPDGIRCTMAEQQVWQLGRDPQTGFVRTWFDNVGVQYGLDALQRGAISAEQFIDLNERIGGYGVAGTVVPQRTAGDPLAVRRLFATGVMNSGSGGLDAVPIIDLRPYLDPFDDIHTRFWSFATRQRLIEANGDADNQVMLVTNTTPSNLGTASAYAVDAMERWLNALAQAPSDDLHHADVVAAKPADVVDGCWTPAGERVDEPATAGGVGSGVCNSHYPVFGDTRTAAGASLINDILKCRLARLDFDGYPVEFTAQQRQRLRAVFPDGVCDWSRPGLGQRDISDVWQDFTRTSRS